jgi:hypothetical protein
MDVNDPKFKEFYFARFAEQLVRAGSMSHADWQYPLRSERPYLILLPDLQSQRQLAGRGMTAWIRLLLSKGETDEALRRIKAQLACGRHCAATPIVVCHLVGLAIANMALDNLELAMQSEKCPNMYWSLATLPLTLHDLGPMVRWELWASPAEMNQPLPPIGDAKWTELATRFVELYGEVSEERYTPEEGLSSTKQNARSGNTRTSSGLRLFGNGHHENVPRRAHHAMDLHAKRSNADSTRASWLTRTLG